METLVWQKIPCLREELYIQLVITYHILKQEKKTESEKSLEEKNESDFVLFSQFCCLLLDERAMDRATWWQWNIKSDHFRRPRNQTRNASGSWLLYTLS